MNIKLLFLTFLFFVSFHVSAQYLQQYFEGYDTSANNSIIIKLDTSAGNIWQVGKPQKTIFNGAATTPNALVTDTMSYYPVKNTSRFNFDFYNNFSWGTVALQWMQKLDMDMHKDGGIIEFSKDSGAIWQNAFNNPNVINFYGYQPANADTAYTGEYAFTGTDANWSNIWLCFQPNTFVPNQKVMFRFTLKTDSISTNREGWMIDNMFLSLTMHHPVNEMKKAESLRVYPTLTNGIIWIEQPENKKSTPLQTIEFISIDGKLLEKFINSNNVKYTIDISKYEAGMYFLKITTNLRTENHPVMIYKN
jgi:hypothetical protein